MLDGLVRDGELSKVVASHLRLNLNGVEELAVVNTNDRANHLGDDDHVAEMRLHDCRLLVRGRLLLRLAELLDETHRIPLEATLEPATRTGVDELDFV